MLGATMVEQRDIDTWRALRNSVREAFSSRELKPTDKDLNLVTRFALEEMEQRGFRIVPDKPIREMHVAVQEALRKGKRRSITWVGTRTKNLWRYVAALDAAPSWRRGYAADQTPGAQSIDFSDNQANPPIKSNDGDGPTHE